jgi:FkbM family methyltransferase
MSKRIAFYVGVGFGNSLGDDFNDFDEVYCFEPGILGFENLNRNFKDNRKIKLFNTGIWTQNGSKDFNQQDHYLYSSFLEYNTEGEFYKLCSRIDPGFDNLVNKYPVEVKRLDTIMDELGIHKIDYLKIDTQGTDFLVVKSLGDKIKFVNKIELKLQFKELYKNSDNREEVINFFQKNGFYLGGEVYPSLYMRDYEARLVFNIKKIPVIGTAIVNGVHWLERLVNSIDFPVENFVIFNNNGRDEITQELEEIKKRGNPFIENIAICHLPHNIGVAAVWNLIIKSYIRAPYWLICNHDISFNPGLLEEIFINTLDDSVGIIHPGGGDFGNGSYDIFLLKDWVISKIGLFDENLYPAYCEDADYIMRLTRWDIDNPDDKIKKVAGLSIPFYHGDALSNEPNYYEHGSQTKKTEGDLNYKLDMINITNFDYMTEKWGPGWRNTNPQQYPMGLDGMPITYTKFDINFVRKKYLGF